MHFFDRAYEGTPLWEIGRPQPEFVRLEEAGAIVGRVLDLGCGTGETAIYLASRGHPVVGIDLSPNAIRRAQTKAGERKVELTLRVASALALGEFGPEFDTVIDSGLFHVFLDPHRPVYAEQVRRVLVPLGRFFLLCFSEEEPTDWGGPRRVSQAEIRETFRDGWEIRSIRPARFEVTIPGVRGKAWLAELRKPAEPRNESRPARRVSREGVRKRPASGSTADEPRRRSPG